VYLPGSSETLRASKISMTRTIPMSQMAFAKFLTSPYMPRVGFGRTICVLLRYRSWRGILCRSAQHLVGFCRHIRFQPGHDRHSGFDQSENGRPARGIPTRCCTSGPIRIWDYFQRHNSWRHGRELHTWIAQLLRSGFGRERWRSLDFYHF
jgi:hypothetical protein